jgi:hypothetical protein
MAVVIRADMPYHQGAEPPWFAGAIERAMVPILAPIFARMDGFDNRMGRLESSMAHIRRVAAIVEPFIPSIY